jgi:hypothetical protein
MRYLLILLVALASVGSPPPVQADHVDLAQIAPSLEEVQAAFGGSLQADAEAWRRDHRPSFPRRDFQVVESYQVSYAEYALLRPNWTLNVLTSLTTAESAAVLAPEIANWAQSGAPAETEGWTHERVEGPSVGQRSAWYRHRNEGSWYPIEEIWVLHFVQGHVLVMISAAGDADRLGQEQILSLARELEARL